MDTENILEYITEGVGEFVQTLFPPDFKGVCIDVGAYDPFWISNSFVFEQLNWNVYCIEPNPNCIPKLSKYRKHVLQYAVSDKELDDVDFFIYDVPTVGQASATSLLDGYRNSDEFNAKYFKEQTKVKIRSLDWLMENEIKQDHIDFLSIDVEGHEMNVLRGTDLTKWKPKVIVIENLFGNFEQLNYLTNFNYKLINRITNNDIYLLEEQI